MTLTKECPACGATESHDISAEGFVKWKGGMLVQRAFPELDECIREWLIAGSCTSCRDEFDRWAEEAENMQSADSEEAPAF